MLRGPATCSFNNLEMKIEEWEMMYDRCSLLDTCLIILAECTLSSVLRSPKSEV